jgi:hypothetical protein
MRKLFLTILAVTLLVSPRFVQAASVTTTFTFTSPVSTGVTLTGVGPCSGSSSSTTPGTLTCTLPIAANTQVATIGVAPTGWTGSITLGGTNASLFAVGGASPNYTLLASSAINTTASDSVTITSTP